jgi:hypothetical protein
MPTAVVILLTDEGQMMVGEIEPEMVDLNDVEPVETFEQGVEVAQVLLLGDEPPPEVEEGAFNDSLAAGMEQPEMDGE